MSVVVPRRAISTVAASTNPKQAILAAVGNLSGLQILGDLVLMGTYFRPEKTAGGILRPDSNVEEDMWQGKVGLILKFGEDAYKDTPDYTFSKTPSIGDWGVYFIGDAKEILIKGYPCRLIRDVSIRIIVDDPNLVF